MNRQTKSRMDFIHFGITNLKLIQEVDPLSGKKLKPKESHESDILNAL